MTRNLQTIGFDADDTLWHNERFFQLTQERFAALLKDHADDLAKVMSAFWAVFRVLWKVKF